MGTDAACALVSLEAPQEYVATNLALATRWQLLELSMLPSSRIAWWHPPSGARFATRTVRVRMRASAEKQVVEIGVRR